MGNRRRNFAIVAAAGILCAAVALIAWSRADTYHREMRAVYKVIAVGEQGWGDEATRILYGIIARSQDKHAFAERLLQEPDGSLVAEGMLLAVKSHHPRGRSLVQQYLNDRRWNWALAHNDQLANQLILHLDGKPLEDWVSSWLSRMVGG